jgi:hypothetical protein
MKAITSPTQHTLENGPLEGHCFLTISMTSLCLVIYSRPSLLLFIQILEYGLQRASSSYFFVHDPALGPDSTHGPIRTSFPFSTLFSALKMEAARFSIQPVLYTRLHDTTFHKNSNINFRIRTVCTLQIKQDTELNRHSFIRI